MQLPKYHTKFNPRYLQFEIWFIETLQKQLFRWRYGCYSNIRMTFNCYIVINYNKDVIMPYGWLLRHLKYTVRDSTRLENYRQISDVGLSHTLVCNKIVDHLDVVWASPVGAAPTTSSFST